MDETQVARGGLYPEAVENGSQLVSDIVVSSLPGPIIIQGGRELQQHRLEAAPPGKELIGAVEVRRAELSTAREL